MSVLCFEAEPAAANGSHNLRERQPIASRATLGDKRKTERREAR
jgi:hypothetical protein